ncbi:MAG: hypothetical protein AAF394_05420 [Planctomycetota bacterium]
MRIRILLVFRVRMRRYFEFLDRDDLVVGSLMMILCMALSDIVAHRDDYTQVYDPNCTSSVKRFRTADRVVSRLAETVVISLEIIEESTLHTRDCHTKYGHLISMLPWVREHVVLNHFKRLAAADDAGGV